MSNEELFMHESIKQLRFRSLWPMGKSPTRLFYFRHFLVLLNCSHLWIGLILHIIVVIKDDLDVNISGDISVLTAILGLQFMLISFVWRQKRIVHLFYELTDFSEFQKPTNFNDKIRQLNFYSKAYAYYCIFGSLTYIYVRYLDGLQCHKNNLEKGLREVCGLLTPTWMPFDIDYFPIKQLFYLSHLIVPFTLVQGGAAVSFTTYEVAACIVLKVEHLQELLKEVFDNPADEISRRKLIYCIKYHNHIIQHQELFDGFYKYCNGSYIIMAGIIIAGLANQIMKENNVGALLHLCGWLFSFFVCCHSGQIILSESENIPNGAFKSNWREVSIDLQKMLMLLIVRSQKKLELHGAPIGVMSYELFVALLKTSYSYFALLNEST